MQELARGRQTPAPHLDGVARRRSGWRRGSGWANVQIVGHLQGLVGTDAGHPGHCPRPRSRSSDADGAAASKQQHGHGQRDYLHCPPLRSCGAVLALVPASSRVFVTSGAVRPVPRPDQPGHFGAAVRWYWRAGLRLRAVWRLQHQSQRYQKIAISATLKLDSCATSAA